MDKDFVELILKKLKVWNSRSVHLNVNPRWKTWKKVAGKVSILDIDYLINWFKDDFMQGLTEKKSFSITLRLNKKFEKKSEIPSLFDKNNNWDIESEIPEDIKLIKKQWDLVKNMNFLTITENDEYQEHGIKSFWFGYPLLAKITKNEMGEEKTIVSPIFIWRLELSRTFSEKDTFKITRNEDDFLWLNEILVSYLEYNEWFKIPNLSEDILEDWIIDNKEIWAYIEELLKKLWDNKWCDESIIDIPADILKYLKDKWINHEIIRSWVFWLFRSHKEKIIEDTSKLPEIIFEDDELIEADNFEYEHWFWWDFTDPSQQLILNQIWETGGMVIQGPPGTGKSKTITAIITNALDNGKKCMVVCEKKTALDVIKENLEKIWLWRLCVIIDDVNSARKDVVDYVRRLCDNWWNKVVSSAYDYNSKLNESQKIIEKIKQWNEIQNIQLLGEKTRKDLIGEYLCLSKKVEQETSFNTFYQKLVKLINDNFDYQEFIETKNIITQAQWIYKSEAVLSILSKLNKEIYEWNYLQAKNKIDNEITKISSLHKDISLIVNNTKEEEIWFINKLNNINSEINDIKWNLEILKLFFQKILEKTWDIEWIEDIENTILKAEKISKYINNSIEKIKELDFKIQNFNRIYKQITEELTEIKEIYPKITNTITTQINNMREISKLIDNLVTHIDNSSKEHGTIYTKLWIWNGIVLNMWWILSSKYKVILNNKHETHKQITSIKEIIDWFAYSNLWIKHIDKFDDFLEKALFLENIKKQLSEITNYKFNIYDIDNLQFPLDVSKIMKYKETMEEQISSIKDSFNELWITLEGESSSLADIERYLFDTKIKYDLISESLPLLTDYHSRIKFYNGLFQWQQKIINYIPKDKDTREWTLYFEIWYIKRVIEVNFNDDIVKNDDKILKLKLLLEDFNKEQLKNIENNWYNRQRRHILTPKDQANIRSLYNKKGGPGEKRNSLRKIVKTNFEQFTDFFPVVLVSPSVCASIMPLEKSLFDVVLFDEASQLRVEETMWALIRWKQKIICGDNQQMPPSSYFSSSQVYLDWNDEDEEIDEDESIFTDKDKNTSLAYSESLLDFAEKKWFNQHMLKIHYRSEHPFLIDFSNYAFYSWRLYPCPERFDHKPIKFYEVGGIFDKWVNETEAMKVIEILRNILSDEYINKYFDWKLPSIWIATFNMYQKKLIDEWINNVKTSEYDSDFVKKLLKYDYTNRFIKNLDTIQWDERDIIIISTTFGKKADGKFIQHYWPINQEKWYRFLNVMITRAKKEIHLITSIPESYKNATWNIVGYSNYEEQIKSYGWQTKSWAWLLHAYITYCKAVENDDEETRKKVLNTIWTIKTWPEEYISDWEIESPFEEEVVDYLSDFIDPTRIKLQHKVWWFRIDIVILSKKNWKPLIAIECDGATYHSSDLAYANDIFRQKILENYWFVFHRIYSTNWFTDIGSEIIRMKEFISSLWEM